MELLLITLLMLRIVLLAKGDGFISDNSTSSTSTNERSIALTAIPIAVETDETVYVNSTSASARNTKMDHAVSPSIPNGVVQNFTNAIETFLVDSNPSEGESLTLSCIVYDRTIVTISWYKNERLSTHDMLAPSSVATRMSISNDLQDVHRRVFNLTIDFATSRDSGDYTCRGLNRPDVTAMVSVKVRFIPSLHYPECYLNGKRKATVTEGEDLRFECRSQKGIPPWHLIWFRQQNQSIAVISTSLHDRNDLITSDHVVTASSDLNGAIFICSLVCLYPACQRDNGPRNCNIGPLVVTPRPPAEPPNIIAIDPAIRVAAEGDDVIFSCSTSLADATAVWFPVNEDQLDDHVIVSDNGTQMTIMNVKPNDTELMACGVFCQDKLITIGKVNLQVILGTSTTNKRTPLSNERTPLSNERTPTPTRTANVTTNSLGDINKHSNQFNQKELVIGASVGGICVIVILLTLVIVWVKWRKYKYTRTNSTDTSAAV